MRTYADMKRNAMKRAGESGTNILTRIHKYRRVTQLTSSVGGCWKGEVQRWPTVTVELRAASASVN